MVTLKTAKFDPVHAGGGIPPASSPGLGVTVDEDVLGAREMVWGD
jgi:hypothetical protein